MTHQLFFVPVWVFQLPPVEAVSACTVMDLYRLELALYNHLFHPTMLIYRFGGLKANRGAPLSVLPPKPNRSHVTSNL